MSLYLEGSGEDTVTESTDPWNGDNITFSTDAFHAKVGTNAIKMASVGVGDREAILDDFLFSDINLLHADRLRFWAVGGDKVGGLDVPEMDIVFIDNDGFEMVYNLKLHWATLGIPIRRYTLSLDEAKWVIDPLFEPRNIKTFAFRFNAAVNGAYITIDGLCLITRTTALGSDYELCDGEGTDTVTDNQAIMATVWRDPTLPESVIYDFANQEEVVEGSYNLKAIKDQVEHTVSLALTFRLLDYPQNPMNRFDHFKLYLKVTGLNPADEFSCQMLMWLGDNGDGAGIVGRSYVAGDFNPDEMTLMQIPLPRSSGDLQGWNLIGDYSEYFMNISLYFFSTTSDPIVWLDGARFVSLGTGTPPSTSIGSGRILVEDRGRR